MSQSKQDASLNNDSAQKSKTTVAQSIAIGSIAGGIEVLVDHPLWSIKTRMQRSLPFTLNPNILYRGILPNAASMVPITALQVGLNRFVQKYYFKDAKEYSDSQRVFCAFLAGIGSALVSCPTEMVMTFQGEKGGKFYTAGRYILNQGGLSGLFTGLPVTAMREGMFTAFFLAGTPILKARMQYYCKNDYVSSLAAGIVSGVGATLASQGFDTVKTIQQGSNEQQSVGLVNAITKLYSKEGVYGFFKGSIPRGSRVVSAVTIMGVVTENMEKKLLEYNSENCDESRLEHKC